MKSWTVDEMLTGRPYPPDQAARLRALWAGRPSLTLLEILHLAIPARDRVWAARRPGALDPDVARAWRERTVTRAVTNHALHCGLPAVEAWAAGWLSGEDRRGESAAAAAAAAEAEAELEAAQAARAAWASLPPAAAFMAESAAVSAATEAAREREYQLQAADLVELLNRKQQL